MICVCLGFPTPAVKLPENQTRLVIPVVNILGRNSRPPLSTHSPETRLRLLCLGVRALPRARDPGAMTRWSGCKWKQDGLWVFLFFFFSPCRRCCVMGRDLPTALLLLYSRRSLKWHAAVSFYQRQAGLEANRGPAAGRKENIMEKKRERGGGQAKLVTFSHDVTYKHFSHKPFSVFFWESYTTAAAPSIFLYSGFLPFCK